MNKTCARCSKVVYPIEELKCLDKTWHKTCFKCHECGMTLNMKTYKGFNKLPYCEAHIPKAKATAIADTPELKRIAENTKIQSNVKYHADFEKQKGKVTQVADDPETLRIKQNTKIISNVAYHGDLEKKAAMERQRGAAEVAESRDNESEYFSETLAAEQLSQYQTQPVQQHTAPPVAAQNKQHTPVPNIMQQSQINAQNNSQTYTTAAQQSNSNQMHQQKQPQPKQTSQNYQQQQPIPHQGNYAPANYQQAPPNTYTHLRSSILQNSHHPSGGHHSQDHTKYYDQYDNYARPTSNAQASQNIYNNNPAAYSNSSQQNYPYQQINAPAQGYNPHYAQLSYSSNSSGTNSTSTGNGGCNGSILSGVGVMGGSSGIGKIADYDPLTDGPRNIPSAPRQSATLIYSSDRGSVHNSAYPKRVGSIADIDPANGIYGSLGEQNNAQNQYYSQQNQMRQTHHHPHQQHAQSQQQKPNMRVYRALYDYEAQDTDEVSFSEGDVIFEVESIDSGWMTGKVERTGKTGMLPANYVEPAII